MSRGSNGDGIWHTSKMSDVPNRYRIHVCEQSGSGTWTADIDLQSGIVVQKGLQQGVIQQDISPEVLATLWICTVRAHAGGDVRIQHQFADGVTFFELTLDEETVTLSFETYGGNYCGPVQEIWNFVRGVR